MKLLDAALAYARRDWSVIPIRPGSKQPAVKWKGFQELRAGEAELHKWFGRDTDWQVAVVTGAVSGNLVIRDFDDLEAYRRWAEHPDPARTLPTVATPRGRHVFFRARDLRYRKLPDGEYRGEAHYTLLPPSRHPSGAEYSWLSELPDGGLPWVDPVEAGLLPPGPAPSSPSQVRPDRPGVPWPPDGLTGRTRRFLKIGAADGNRNTELFCAACDMASKGIGRSEAEETLLGACGRCQPPYPARGTIQSAYSRARWQAGSNGDPWGPYSIPRCIANRRDQGASDKLVWAALDHRQRDKANCWPSLETIGRDTGLCRATAAESVKRLERRGLLAVRRTYGEASRYTTHLSEIPTRLREGPSVQEKQGPVEKPDTNNHSGGRGAWESARPTRSGDAEKNEEFLTFS